MSDKVACAWLETKVCEHFFHRVAVQIEVCKVFEQVSVGSQSQSAYGLRKGKGAGRRGPLTPHIHA